MRPRAATRTDGSGRAWTAPREGLRRFGLARPWALTLLLVASAAGCGGASPVVPSSAPVTRDPDGHAASLDARALSLARDVWTALDQTTNSCDEFDYFPRGGARIFACHMFSLVSYERIVAVAGRAPFRAGPHGSGLNLHATNDFGHYDPEFVRFVAQHAVPARHDSAFRAATQAHYDAYVGPLARIFYATHQKLVNNPACFAAERDEYAAAIARGDTQDYVEPWFFFMNPTYCAHRRGEYEDYERTGFDGGYDGNVVKTCVGFWLRRAMDGTEAEFFEALTTLLRTYEPSVLER